jgi:putative ABC transport system permease protein
MVLCLLFGLILTLSIISSASMYSRAAMERVLTSDLNELTIQNKLYAGGFVITKRLDAGLTSGDQKDRLKRLKELNKQAIVSSSKINIPLLSEKEILRAENFGVNISPNSSESAIRPEISIEGISNMQEHAKIIKGRMFSTAKNKDNEYEVIASEKTMNERNFCFCRTGGDLIAGSRLFLDALCCGKPNIMPRHYSQHTAALEILLST